MQYGRSKEYASSIFSVEEEEEEEGQDRENGGRESGALGEPIKEMVQ